MPESFSTPHHIKAYQALVIAAGLKYYAAHGVTVNKAYTPRNMLRTATALTGKPYKSRDYLQAAADLQEFAYAQKGIS